MIDGHYVGGQRLVYPGGGGARPDPQLGRAALEQTALAREAQEWYRNEYESTRDERDRATQTAQQVANVNLASMQAAQERADRLDAEDRATYAPIRQRLANEAMSYDTPERRNQAAAEAAASVNSNVAAQRAATGRSLARMGVNPESGRSLALMQSGDIDAARAVTGATSAARKNVEAMGLARMSDAVGLGNGTVARAAAERQTALGAGQSAVANQGAAASTAMGGAGLMGQGYQTASGFMQNANQLYGQMSSQRVAQQQADAANEQATYGAVGTAAMAAAVFF